MKHQFTLIRGLIFFHLMACGKVSETQQTSNQEIEDPIGSYRAILRPYNNQLSGQIPNGVAELNLTSNRLNISSWIDDSANVVHQQFILDGEECPDQRHDRNQDGIIDMAETLHLAKSVLLSLDSDLSSQTNEQNQFPRGDFTYIESADLDKMKKNLFRINFNNKVMIVLGVAPEGQVPLTVSTFNSQTPQLSTPILCGKIQKIEDATP